MKYSPLRSFLKSAVFTLVVLVMTFPGMAQFKPTDIPSVIGWWSAMGDPYAASTKDPGGLFVDSGLVKQAADGDPIYAVKDLAGGDDTLLQTAAISRPIYRKGDRHGPFWQISPPNREVEWNTGAFRLRVSNISATTGVGDIYVGSGSNNTLTGSTAGATTARIVGIDSGWMYISPSAFVNPFVAGETLSWTDGTTAKTAVVVGRIDPNSGSTVAWAEGPQFFNGGSRAISSAGGCSVYIVLRSKQTVTGVRSTWFCQGTNLLFGGFFDGAATPCMHCYAGTSQKLATNLNPSHSPNIYWARMSGSFATIGMGDISQEVASPTAISTTPAAFVIGAFTPGGANQWIGAGDYYEMILCNARTSDAEHAQIMTYLRAIHNLPEYTGLLAVAGHSIFSGENSNEAWYTKLGVEQFGVELRVGAYPNITQSTIRTNLLATTGQQAWIAKHVNQSNYQIGRKWVIVPNNTNDYTITPNNVPAAMTALRNTVDAANGLGLQPILTTDLDKYTAGNTQWRIDADIGNPLIRLMGYPVIDWAAYPPLGTAGAVRNQMNGFAGYVHWNLNGNLLMAEEAKETIHPIMAPKPTPIRNRNGSFVFPRVLFPEQSQRLAA